ncbi:Gfo/Idh/MocA family protein [Sphingomonas lycopersici]|uniref:Gfo/Idh/MocA family oxidoreductase n=1 Tax=Sphingomonas lycopersici TaxID=2951807 RepID=A0AA41ZJD6_9SPHN|nr:Gfo/Idh/MocA family oxidoreductase [Sphingomonas lycopersici]MCW6537776.1 Gfo/Idh/MocA family oxidoreductase [Sphingomonas lycopersici]
MDRIRLGVVGLGRGFMLTLPALTGDERIVLAGAFDPRAEARERFAQEFDALAFPTLGAMLGAPDIDALYIASPHEHHAAQAIAAIKAGKHVLVEKPMAVTVADCAAMAEAARRFDRVLVVGPSHGFDAPVRAAAALIASGDHGALRQILTFNFTDFVYRPRRPEELDAARGGGVIFSQGAHQIDVVRRLAGQPIRTVRAVAGNWDETRPNDGAYTALLAFEHGAAASLTYSGYAHYDSDELTGWIGELGRPKAPTAHADARRTLARDEAAAKLARTYGNGAPPPPAPHHEHFGFVLASCERADIRLTPTGLALYADHAHEWRPLDPPAVPRRAVIDEFVAAIHRTSAPIHDGRWGLETMAACAALIESSRRGTDIFPATIIHDALEQIAL